MTIDWKKAIKYMRKFAKLYARNKTDENFELKKKYRNLATKECRKAIKHYMENYIGKDEGKNPRDFLTLFSHSLATKLLRKIPSIRIQMEM